MKEIIDFIKGARHLIAFTGAGVSVLSGIKDFRGKNGLYKTMDAEKIFDLDVFKSNPGFYYENTKEFIYGLDEKEPAVTHRVLSKLEEKGYVKTLITQNIDMLHQKAGSKNVIELHGSAKVHYCMKCGIKTSEKSVFEVARRGEVPKCSSCGGVLKPQITFFGEALPMDALSQALKEAKNADAIMVLGSSLTVYPAASLPSYVLDHGGKLMIVNDMATPYDSYASLRYDDLATVFNYLEEEIENSNL